MNVAFAEDAFTLATGRSDFSGWFPLVAMTRGHLDVELGTLRLVADF